MCSTVKLDSKAVTERMRKKGLMAASCTFALLGDCYQKNDQSHNVHNQSLTPSYSE